MKKLFVSMLTAALLIIFYPLLANASGLSCDDVNGASIFGYDGDEYVYIGSISNEFGGDSIANEFGSYGNEFSSKSIFNDFSRWGNEFGSYSATNDFSSKPPILVSKSLKKIGYLTANDARYPSMNIYTAKACAQRTMIAAADHEGIKFESESDLSRLYETGDSSTSISPDIYCKAIYGAGAVAVGTDCFCGNGYILNSQKNGCIQNTVVCPANTSPKGDGCACNAGFIYNQQLNSCIDYASSCRFKYGANSYGDSQHCYCSGGYEFNKEGSSCIQESTFPTVTAPVNIITEGTPLRSPDCGGLLKLNNRCIAPTLYCESQGKNLDWSDTLGKCICKTGFFMDENNICIDQALECKKVTGENSYFSLVTNSCASCPSGTKFDEKDRLCKVLAFQGIPKTKVQMQSCNVVGVKSTKFYYLKSNVKIKGFGVTGKICFVSESEAIKAKYKKGI